MPAMEILSGYVTAPSTTFTAFTMSNGSVTIRNGKEPISLIAAGGLWQTAGVLRVRSPLMHDNVQGIRLQSGTAAYAKNLYPLGAKQPLHAQDTLVAELTGSATSGDLEIGWLLVHYADVMGLQMRLSTWDKVKSAIKHVLGVENTAIATGTDGAITEELINADMDCLKANTDYALLGYVCGAAEAGVVTFRSTETSNLRIGGPGPLISPLDTRDWFKKLSVKTGLPTIPIFNSANKAGWYVGVGVDENGGNPTVVSILAELG